MVSAAPMFRFTSAARSHVGHVRSVNEDAFLDRPAVGLWAVADGMGGHSLGDVASEHVVNLLATVPPAEKAEDLLTSVHRVLDEANADLIQLGSTRALGGVVGSTVVVLLVFGLYYACVWAGDSRVYRLHEDRIEQLTRDHSRVQEMIDSGRITAGEASRQPGSNIITRAVGAESVLRLSAGQGRIASGDVFLLCSDGLTRRVADADIERMLSLDPQAAADALVKLALEAGGEDNVTVVIVRCVSTGQPAVQVADEATTVPKRAMPAVDGADSGATHPNPG
jgi:serine/threonine protein phosphatase PrpC